MGKINELLTFTGAALGTEIRGSIGQLITWRKRPRIQDKYYWFAPADPRSARQQQRRYKFRAVVALVKYLSYADRAYWAAQDPNRGACPWILNFMSFMMKGAHELIKTATRPEVITAITTDEYTYPTADLSPYVPLGTTLALVQCWIMAVGDAPRLSFFVETDTRGGGHAPHHAWRDVGWYQVWHMFVEVRADRSIDFEVWTNPGETTDFRVILEGYVAPEGA